MYVNVEDDPQTRRELRSPWKSLAEGSEDSEKTFTAADFFKGGVERDLFRGN